MEPTVSSLVAAADTGDSSATEALFARLYSELHRIARRELARSGPAAGLGVTSLLHEAYLDMAARDGASFPDRAHFMGYASRVMRGLIIDSVRRRQAQKRGGRYVITGLRTDIEAKGMHHDELTRISGALDRLADLDPALAAVVDLKFFCGFVFEEIAALQGVTERTVQRRWEKARIYLHRSIRVQLL